MSPKTELIITVIVTFVISLFMIVGVPFAMSFFLHSSTRTTEERVFNDLIPLAILASIIGAILILVSNTKEAVRTYRYRIKYGDEPITLEELQEEIQKQRAQLKEIEKQLEEDERKRITESDKNPKQQRISFNPIIGTFTMKED